MNVTDDYMIYTDRAGSIRGEVSIDSGGFVQLRQKKANCAKSFFLNSILRFPLENDQVDVFWSV